MSEEGENDSMHVQSALCFLEGSESPPSCSALQLLQEGAPDHCSCIPQGPQMQDVKMTIQFKILHEIP